MFDEILTPLEKDVQIGKKLGLFDDRAGRKIIECFGYGIEDDFVVGEIGRRVNMAKRRIAISDCPLLPARLRLGNFIFGYDQWGNEIRIDRQMFNSHTVAIADTGGGKTNISEFYATQMALAWPEIKSVVLIDARKKEYRRLRPLFATVGIDLKIIRGRKLKINPLQVPYRGEPFEYAALISDILARTLCLPHRSSTLLTTTIMELYEKCGILTGADNYPTLFDVYEKVENNKSANAAAKQATLDNLKEVLLSSGDILAYHQGWPPHVLFQQHVVVELTGLIEKTKNLILNYLIGAEFFLRLTEGYSNRPLDTFISIDEGIRLLSDDANENVLLDQIGLLRGASLGLQVNLLNTSTRFTASTKIVGRCSSDAEYTSAGHLMGLNSEQIMWCAHHLNPGWFVGQAGSGPWRYPFLFHVPLIKHVGMQREEVSDQIADGSIKDIENLPTLPASKT